MWRKTDQYFSHQNKRDKIMLFRLTTVQNINHSRAGATYALTLPFKSSDSAAFFHTKYHILSRISNCRVHLNTQFRTKKVNPVVYEREWERRMRQRQTIIVNIAICSHNWCFTQMVPQPILNTVGSKYKQCDSALFSGRFVTYSRLHFQLVHLF